MTLNTSSGILLARATASNASTIDFDDVFSSDHDLYEIVIKSVVPGTDIQALQCRLGNAAVYVSAAATYHWVTEGGISNAATHLGDNSNSATEIQLTEQEGSDTDEESNLIILVYNPVPAVPTLITSKESGRSDTASTMQGVKAAGGEIAAVSRTSIQFLYASGVIETGDFSVFAKPL